MLKINNASIYTGDCLTVLKNFESESVNCCITSPPYYGLRNYLDNDKQIGLEESPQIYIDKLVKVFGEVKRVLSNDGTVWLNIADTYCSYKNGVSVKQTIGSDERNDITTPSRNRTMMKDAGIKNKDLIGIPWMLAFALRADGWYLRQDIIWNKKSCMPESVIDRCTKSHEYIFLLSKSEKYYFDYETIASPAKQLWGTRNRASGKYSNEGTGLQPHGGLDKNYTTARKRSVWTVGTDPFLGNHYACYPRELIEPCVLAGTKENDVVLDIFNGSGTTGEVALMHGRKYIGIELNEEYVNITKQRLEKVVKKLPKSNFFDE